MDLLYDPHHPLVPFSTANLLGDKVTVRHKIHQGNDCQNDAYIQQDLGSDGPRVCPPQVLIHLEQGHLQIDCFLNSCLLTSNGPLALFQQRRETEMVASMLPSIGRKTLLKNMKGSMRPNTFRSLKMSTKRMAVSKPTMTPIQE